MCYGHSLSPVHYPLGSFPLLVSLEMWEIAPAAIAGLAAEIVFLTALVRGTPLAGHVWRGLVLYVAAHLAEFGILLGVPVLARCGWTGDAPELVESAAAVLAVGITVRTTVGKGLYGRRVPWPRVWRVGLAPGLAGYGATLLGVTILCLW